MLPMNKEFIVCLDAGHGMSTPGKRTPAALGEIYKEHLLNSRVVQCVYNILQKRGITAKITTCYNVNDISLRQRCSVSNRYNADLFISIHHNAGANLTKASGIVLYHYPGTWKAELAKIFYNDVIRVTGLKGNRANPIKATKSYYVLKHTKAPAFLLECGFMDSTVDYPIITKSSYSYTIAAGIADFIEHFKERKGL